MVWTTDAEKAIKFVELGERLFDGAAISSRGPGWGWEIELTRADADMECALWWLIDERDTEITRLDCEEWIDEMAQREALAVG